MRLKLYLDGPESEPAEVDQRVQPISADRLDAGLTCSHCKVASAKLIDVVDFVQLGFWQDTHTSVFQCQDCKQISIYRWKLEREVETTEEEI